MRSIIHGLGLPLSPLAFPVETVCSPFLVGAFMYPRGGRDVGSVITWNRRLFERAQLFLVHRGGWTQSLVFITPFLGKLLNFVSLSGQVLWFGDLSTAPVNVFWCESFVRVLNQKNCENLSPFLVIKEKKMWVEWCEDTHTSLPRRKISSFPLLILSLV